MRRISYSSNNEQWKTKKKKFTREGNKKFFRSKLSWNFLLCVAKTHVSFRSGNQLSSAGAFLGWRGTHAHGVIERPRKSRIWPSTDVTPRGRGTRSVGCGCRLCRVDGSTVHMHGSVLCGTLIYRKNGAIMAWRILQVRIECAMVNS